MGFMFSEKDPLGRVQKWSQAKQGKGERENYGINKSGKDKTMYKYTVFF